MTDLWVEATHDFDREENDRQLVVAREQVADLWQFLASASNQDDFENRKALISDRLDEAAQGETRQRLEAALDQDFAVVVSQRRVVRPKGHKAEAKFRAQVKSDDGEKWVDGGLFENREDADKDAARLGEEHGNETQVIEVEGSRKEAGAYDEFGDWKYDNAQAVITKLKAVDGYDEPAILAAIKGIGYDTFQVLDEKPGYFGNYYDEDWHWKLRRARNSADGFFEALNATASKTADAKFQPNNPEFMAGFRAGSADARTQPSMNSPGANMVDYGHSVPEGASSKFWEGYESGYHSATEVHMGSQKTADFPGTTCDLCGFTPKNPRDLYYSAMSQQTQCVNGAACLKRREKKGSRKTAEKYRAEVAGINESVWSNNALEYDTIEEAQAWLSDLSMRWFGYDMGRVVPVSTPRNETVDPSGDIFQNFRSGSRKQAWTEDMSDVSYMAEKLMILTGDAAEGVKAPAGSTGDAEMLAIEDKLVEMIKPLAGDITDEDQAILEDYNFHITNRAIDRVKGRKKFSTRKTAYYSIEWSGGYGTDSGYSSEAEAVRTALENGDPEAGIFYNEASGDSYLGTAQALADELDLEEFNFQAHVQGSGSRGSARRHPFGRRRVGIGGPDAGYGPSGQTEDPTMGRRDMQTPCRVCGDLIWPAEQWENGYVHVDGRPRDHNAFPAHDVFPFEGSKTAAWAGYTLVDESKLSDQYHKRFIGYFESEVEAKAFAESEYGVPADVWSDRVYLTSVPGNPEVTVVDGREVPFVGSNIGAKTAAEILDEDPENNTMTTAQGVWTMEYDSESMKRMKEADDYEPWFPEFPNEAEWSQPHHYKLTGPNGQVHEFSAQGDSVAGPWYSAWEQARSIVSQASRKTAQAGPPEPWPDSACGEQDEDTFCIRDTDHEGDHQFRSRFWIEQKMDEAGLTSIEEELPEEGEEQAEEVPEEAPAEEEPEKKGEVPPQFKKKTSRPKADMSKVEMIKGAPFADYKDFADCTSKNSDKDDPEAYCGYIKHKVEDTKESILIASALLPRLSHADFEQAIEELGERVSG